MFSLARSGLCHAVTLPSHASWPVFINSIGMSGGQFIQISKNPIFLSFFPPSAFLLSWRPEQICPQFEIKTSKERGMNEIGGWATTAKEKVFLLQARLTIEMFEGERFL